MTVDFKTRRSSHQGTSSILTFSLIALILLLGGSSLWLAYQSGWDRDVFMGRVTQSLRLPSKELLLFDQSKGFTQTEARKIYLEAQTALANQHYLDAVSHFKSLEKVYPGLLDLILLHESDAYAQMPDEFRAQQSLTQLLKKRPQSPLAPQARYQRGQSHLRAKEYKKAQHDFKAVIRLYPKSDYALGSHYYLGVLTQKEQGPDHIKKALTHWKHYMTTMPDGRFSYDIATQMAELIQNPTSDEHRLIGLGYAYSERAWEKALPHLKQAPLKDVWLETGEAQLKTQQTQAGLNTLTQGISLATDKQRLQKGVDMLARNSNKTDTLKRLSALSKKELLSSGGDYVFWKLAQLNPERAQAYYQQILTRYPKGDYSPESSWQRLWSLVRSGHYTKFLKQSDAHLAQYPYARSAAATLFWRGKIWEKQGQINDATWAYEALLKKYPVSYYAFRAAGRLTDLKSDAGDPGWQIQKNRLYPPPKANSALSIIPEIKAELVSPQEPTLLKEQQRFLNCLQELEAIGAMEDIPLLLQAETGSVPALVKSQQMHRRGDRPQGIRIIRDALYQRAREGNLAGFNPTRNEMKLLYPLYFTPEIEKEAPVNDLDPFIVQSLMREESYFNELAVSSSNALGLMQLLPSTAQEVAGWVGIKPFQRMSLFQPEINIKLGSRYLGHLHQLFDGDSMLSVGAYNGGPNAMKRWVQQSPSFQQDRDMFVELIPYVQTRNYIKKVYASFWNYSRLYSSE